MRFLVLFGLPVVLFNVPERGSLPQPVKFHIFRLIRLHTAYVFDAGKLVVSRFSLIYLAGIETYGIVL